MSRRLSPALTATFVVVLALSGAAAFVLRTSQLDSGRSSATASGRVKADTTMLTVDSTAATVPDTTVADTAPKGLGATPAISGAGALLRSASDPEPRVWVASTGCSSLLTSGAATGCERLSSGGVEVAWVVYADGGVDVLERDPAVDPADQWSLALRSGAPPVAAPKVVDLTGDGQPEIVVGWRDASGTLSLDVVEVRDGHPGVRLHLSLPFGRSVAVEGQLDGWIGLPQTGDPVGSPSVYDHWVFRVVDGAWKVEPATREGQPPKGDF